LLTKLCAKACIETVSLQYDGTSVLATEVKNEPAEISKNKLTDMLMGCPNFGPFFQSLETKEKRLFANMCDIVEIKSEKKYISDYSPANSIIIILKGELIGFNKYGPNTVYRMGEVIGIRETLFGSCWKENIFGRQNGYFVKIQNDFFNDLGNTFAKAAMHIMDFFVKTECQKIKDKYREAKISLPENSFALLENLHKEEDLELEARKANSTSRFAEINVQPQKLKPSMTIEPQKAGHEMAEVIKPSKDVPPLMRHQVFSSIVKQDVEAVRPFDKKEEQKKEKISSFVKEKLESQYLEQKRIEKLIKERKKKGLVVDEAMLSALGVRNTAPTGSKADMQTLEALENEYERLKNEYNLREVSRERVNTEYDKLMSKLQETEEEVKKLKDKTIYITAERDRLKLHKELMGKMTAVGDGETFAQKLTKFRSDERNFNDAVGAS
jgi:hypothetical protein